MIDTLAVCGLIRQRPRPAVPKGASRVRAVPKVDIGMDETYSADGGLLPLPLAIRVDRVCLRFEAAWQVGGRPRIEDVLAEASGQECEVLLKELILIEVFYRRRTTSAPSHRSIWIAFSRWIRPGWTKCFHRIGAKGQRRL